VLDLYLRDPGDQSIKSVRDLISQSTFYNHAPSMASRCRPRPGFEGLLTRTDRFTRKSDGSPYVRKPPYRARRHGVTVMRTDAADAGAKSHGGQ